MRDTNGAMQRLVGLTLLLFVACASEPTTTGVWEGPLTLTGPGPTTGAGRVQLVVEERDHRLRGSFIWADGTEDLEPLSNVPFEIEDGVAANGEVYFLADRLLPNGDARIVLHGTLDGDRLEGDAEIRVTSTQGETLQEGTVTLKRADTEWDG